MTEKGATARPCGGTGIHAEANDRCRHSPAKTQNLPTQNRKKRISSAGLGCMDEGCAHRCRLCLRLGHVMARFEVLGREDDCAPIRSLGERLAEDDPQAKLIAAVAQANGSTTIASRTMKSISQESTPSTRCAAAHGVATPW